MFDTRMEVLEESIDKHIQRIERAENEGLVEIHHLFYDEKLIEFLNNIIFKYYLETLIAWKSKIRLWREVPLMVEGGSTDGGTIHF